jgi:hypothetical protein
VRAFVLGHVLAINKRDQRFDVWAVVGRNIHGVINAHAVDVAGGILAAQGWPTQAQANSITHRVGNGVQPGRAEDQLLLDVDLVAGLGIAFQPLLIQIAITELPFNARVVDRAVRSLDRGAVQLERAQAINQPNNGAPAPEIDDAGSRDRRNAVLSNARLFLFGLAALAADHGAARARGYTPRLLCCCAHAPSRMQKPAEAGLGVGIG